jgi:hypothetical protein
MRLRSLEAFLIILIVVASVEWTYLAYLRGMIDLQLAVTLIVVEAPTELFLAWVISRVLEKPDELARKFAVEKQKLEEIDRDRRAIYEAIKEWIQPPPTRWQIGGQQEPLYLGEKLPRYPQKIDGCLSRNYPLIWADLQEFRNKYAELMALRTSIPEEFWEEINGVRTLHLRLLEARENSMRHQLLAMQRQLVQQINIEIVEKLDTELKC